MRLRSLLVAALATAALVAPQAASAAPTAIVLKGSGADVRTVSLRAGAAVLVMSYSGSSNFIVQVKGPGVDDLAANEIGSWRGQTVVTDVRGGRYRIGIDAEGSWTIRITQPRSGGRALLGSFSGSGAKVIRVRTGSTVEPVLQASYRGEGNFIVQIVGIGSVTGSSLLVNEIGSWRGRVLVDELPRGSYLLWVYASGPWTLKFTP